MIQYWIGEESRQLAVTRSPRNIRIRPQDNLRFRTPGPFEFPQIKYENACVNWLGKTWYDYIWNLEGEHRMPTVKEIV